MDKTLSVWEIVSVGLMLFSIFFGAGNLIFPPALGQAAGTAMVPAAAGFLITGVGLPLLGVLAIGLAGGAYTESIEKNVHPKFAVGLLVVLNLTIGPLFAIPRTGAVAFEVGVRSFLGDGNAALGQFLYTLAFFGISYALALNPSKVVDHVGKILTPLLLFFMALLFVWAIGEPIGELQPPGGAYASMPFLQGFEEGYLTMDLLAFIVIGTIIIQSIQAKGVKNRATLGRICIVAGLISAALMSIVYISLTYLGGSSVELLGQSENGGVILMQVSRFYFGQAGGAILACIITFACLTTSCGLASSCAWYFSELSHGKVQYQRLLVAILLFSLGAANIGLTGLISLSVPFLVAVYPVVIVLVLLSLLRHALPFSRDVFRWSIGLTLAFSVFGGLNAAGIEIGAVHRFFLSYIPLYEANFGWVVPAVCGAAIGQGVAFLRGAGGRRHGS